MCLIIDTNCIGQLTSGHRDMLLVLEWLVGTKRKKPKGNLTYSLTDKMKDEWFGPNASQDFLHLLGELTKAGKPPRVVPVAEVQQALNDLTYVLKSNDRHIVGLAIASGCRVLVSNDQKLHTDFIEATKEKSRRGKIYQNSTHGHLLDGYRCV